ncbi:hypothetical protein T492DRAFT_634021 [Pavlovales sp. CCMP2436]|nr:hypothetical protein T492DRAFT_634021 [Pavlovales sp. CCMP2436]|mmetsp:Transcript_17559/g.40768  ORF Transcript_17559/g.40768 Transcript_17559/m.40768 type:complete len:210 (-) Transcript_17559:182-811(-)
MPSTALERARALRAAPRAPLSELESQRYGEWLATQNFAEHTPRVNDLTRRPTRESISEDLARLRDRLAAFGLAEREVTGDGNCQFRAISDQLYSDQEQHSLVRSMCIDQLLFAPERYRDYVVAEDYDDYVQNMSKTGEWGDNVTLQALSDYLNAEINLVTSFDSDGLVRVVPQPDSSAQGARPQGNGSQSLFCSFWAEIHYQSIVMAGV